MAKIKHYSRKFLNKAEGLAAIECSINSLSFSAGIDASINITDCNRLVYLDFSAYNAKDLDGRIAKLDLLLAEISKVRDIISSNADFIKEQLAEEEKKHKVRRAKTAVMPTVCDDEL
jgi:hypothetical protein